MKAAKEREQVSKDIQSLRDAGIFETTTTTAISETDLILPMARIKKIVKLDPEVKGLSKEALLLIARSAELFMTQLGSDTFKLRIFKIDVHFYQKMLWMTRRQMIVICSYKKIYVI